MKDTIITIFCLCDDLLQALDYQDDPQAQLSGSEVMLVPLVAACFFSGKIEKARQFLVEHDYLSFPLSQSRLNRRIHALPLEIWHILFALLGGVFKQHNPKGEFVIDSLPIPACDKRPKGTRHPPRQVVPGREASRLYRQQKALFLGSQGAYDGHGRGFSG